MNLTDLINRHSPPFPWLEGDNIPWNDPGFSQRMLKEHLSQEHDAASRRFEIIDRQVDWIHSSLLGKQPSRILELGCGPGLYMTRLARLGHSCFGIDYSPASIGYAVEKAQQEQLDCHYTLQDIRLADYPPGVELVMLIYGEFNVFQTVDIIKILEKANQALRAGGQLLLEPHTFQIVKQFAQQSDSWYTSTGGLFHDGPHLVLQENSWDETSHTLTRRYYVQTAVDGHIERYAQSMQAYHREDYRRLLDKYGFGEIEFYKGLSPQDPQDGLFVIVARKV